MKKIAKIKFPVHLTLLLSFALSLRLINLNQSFWLDEAAQAIESARPLSDQWQLAADFHPPLYHLILHFWMLAGRSEIWLRIPSVLFALGSITALYLLSNLLKRKKEGMLSAIFLATSGFHLWYSQEARPYMLFAFLSFLSTYFLLKKNWFLYTLFIIASLYTSYFTLFLIISHGFVIFLQEKKEIKKLAISLIISLVLFIPWLPYLVEQLSVGITGNFTGWQSVVSVNPVRAIPLTFAKFILGKGSIENNLLYALAIIPAFILFLYGYFICMKNNIGKTLLILFFVPFTTIFLVSFLIPIIAPQRFLFLMPYFLLITSFGLTRMSKKIQILSIAVILTGNIFGIYQYISSPNVQREQWREAVRFVESDRNSNNIALFAFPDAFAPFIWYSKGVVEGRGIAHNFIIGDEDLIKLNTELKDKNRVYFFQYLTGLTDPNNKTRNFLLSRGFVESAINNFPGVGFVYTYENK